MYIFLIFFLVALMSHQRVQLTLVLLSLSLVVVLHKRKEPYYSSVKKIFKKTTGFGISWGWSLFQCPFNLQEFLTVVNLEVGSADGLSCPVCSYAGVGACVFCAHVHQDEAVPVPWAGYFISFGIRFDPQDILHWFFLQPGDHRSRGAW